MALRPTNQMCVSLFGRQVEEKHAHVWEVARV